MKTGPMLTIEQLETVLSARSPLRRLINKAKVCTARGDHNGAFCVLLDALKGAREEFGPDHENCVPLKIAIARADIKQSRGERDRGKYSSYARQMLEEVTAVLPEPYKELMDMVATCNYSVGIVYGSNDRG